MPKCENCYHHEICIFHGASGCERCMHYKDKSLIVELPCKEIYEKIGDSFYCITDESGEVIEVIVGVIEIDCEGREWIETMAVDYDYETEDGMSKYINFRFADYGKTLFLTREEAEKALRESDNHD